MRLMREATTQRKVDYFRLPRPLWRKLKKYLPKHTKKSTPHEVVGPEPQIEPSSTPSGTCCGRDANGRLCTASGLGSPPERGPRAFPEMEAHGPLREADEEDGRVLRQRARRGRLEMAGDGFQEFSRSSGRRENGQEPHG